MPSAATPHPFPDPARTAVPTGLQGLTLLAVEDSRFASDALRLMCQRTGARLRRAEGIAAAQAHLAVYRPDVVLVDLGLPDGRGEVLIRSLTASSGPPLVLGMSGDPEGRASAMAAGAAGFMEKPIPSLVFFQQAILALLPDHHGRALATQDGWVRADPLALRDDLAVAMAALSSGPGPDQRTYLSGFLAGIARQTKDALLGEASRALRQPDGRLEPLARVLRDRMTAADQTRS